MGEPRRRPRWRWPSYLLLLVGLPVVAGALLILFAPGSLGSRLIAAAAIVIPGSLGFLRVRQRITGSGPGDGHLTLVYMAIFIVAVLGVCASVLQNVPART